MGKNVFHCFLSLRKQTLFVAVLLLQQVLPIDLWAQNIPVTGTVKNEKGEPLQGATISLKGSTVSVVSGEDGKFNILAPPKGVLSISVIGYAGVEEKIDGRQTLTIVLQEK